MYVCVCVGIAVEKKIKFNVKTFSIELKNIYFFVHLFPFYIWFLYTFFFQVIKVLLKNVIVNPQKKEIEYIPEIKQQKQVINKTT